MDRAGAIDAALAALAPRLPARERAVVLDQALASRGLRKAAAETAAWLSLVAHIRHRHTDYDTLLADGYDPDAARFFTLAATNAKLAEWSVHRRIDQS